MVPTPGFKESPRVKDPVPLMAPVKRIPLSARIVNPLPATVLMVLARVMDVLALEMIVAPHMLIVMIPDPKGPLNSPVVLSNTVLWLIPIVMACEALKEVIIVPPEYVFIP